MERVLYNTVLGAWPVQADGTSFYYSDYAATGQKVWYKDKWPCCSGTFPQLAADYHLSVYLRGEDGVYVNLFTPSTVKWTNGAGRYGLTQQTKYPVENTITVQVAASQPAEFTVYMRIPSWTETHAVLSVNGSRVTSPVEPGTFAAIRRTWKDGDRVELELPMPLHLQPVDVQHPNYAALTRGPLVLFAIADSQPSFEQAELLRARSAANDRGDWLAASAGGQTISMRPFMNIQDEKYSTYVRMKS